VVYVPICFFAPKSAADPTATKPRVRELEEGKAGPIQLDRERERYTWNLEEGRERETGARERRAVLQNLQEDSFWEE
jgi:hypothetical protein